MSDRRGIVERAAPSETRARKSSFLWPLGGAAAALLVSPLVALGMGRASLYALVLFPLAAVAWLLTRYPARDLGLRIGRAISYATAFAYPILIVFVAAAIVTAMAGASPVVLDSGRCAREIGIVFAYSLPVALLTEEGYFRGWLWGACRRSGFSQGAALWFMSFSFAAWHFAVTLLPGSHFSAPETGLYLANILLIGLNFGLLRMLSGSIGASAVAHACWNALVYVAFGSPETTGVLHVALIKTYDPERGVIGLGLNGAAALALWRSTTVLASDRRN